MFSTRIRLSVLSAVTSICATVLDTHYIYAHTRGRRDKSLSLSLSVFVSLFFFSLSLAARGYRALCLKESLHGVRLERKVELVLFLFREVRDYFPGDAG